MRVGYLGPPGTFCEEALLELMGGDGDLDEVPYPTVVEYSGYDPSRPGTNLLEENAEALRPIVGDDPSPQLIRYTNAFPSASVAATDAVTGNGAPPDDGDTLNVLMFGTVPVAENSTKPYVAV